MKLRALQRPCHNVGSQGNPSSKGRWQSSQDVTTLMSISPQALSSKAAQKELSKDFDAAFELHVKAAETFIHLAHTLPDASAKASCKTAARKALERAEQIKKAKQDVRPVAANPYSAGEFAIEGSRCIQNWPVDWFGLQWSRRIYWTSRRL